MKKIGSGQYFPTNMGYTKAHGCERERGREREREMEKGEDGGGAEAAVFSPSEIEYVSYGGEHHLPLIMGLVDDELSEPYSIFTYRYFVYLWPNLSFLVSLFFSLSGSLFLFLGFCFILRGLGLIAWFDDVIEGFS